MDMKKFPIIRLYELWSNLISPNYIVEDIPKYLSGFNWIPNWLDNYFFNKFSDFLLGIIFTICFFICIQAF